MRIVLLLIHEPLLANHGTDRRSMHWTSRCCFLTRVLQSYLSEALTFVQSIDFSKSNTPDTVRYDLGHALCAHLPDLYLASLRAPFDTLAVF